ncbi:hypothetical protein E1287_29770 [Actinomadura sp. KC06]|uniref:hypothetical protein n=1 Tax=Actinomadura sp. KC06 TaxID=2530369 RepID=UPI0010523921|nr:hypothetical protein [Actinomadura sp. KC06]TDD30165.1 hypothetical protein E1287_29770 [Actinomadura sp. KC06]
MFRSVPVVAGLALGAALLVSGCQGNSYSCMHDKCHVTVSGAGQTIEVKDLNVTVSEITAQGMTVSAGGSAPTKVAVGESAQVGGVTIKVTSVEGEQVKFDLG